MNVRNEKNKLWEDKDLMFVASLVVFGVFVAILLILSFVTSLSLSFVLDSAAQQRWGLFSIIGVVVIFALPTIVLMRQYYFTTADVEKAALRTNIIYALGAIILYAVGTLVTGLLFLGAESPAIIQVPDGRTLAFTAAFFIGMVVLLPLFEEFLMRGVLIEKFFMHPSELTLLYATWLPKWIKEKYIRFLFMYVIQAVIFLLMHSNGSYVSVAMNSLLALILTTVYVRTRSVWTCVLLHSAINASGLAMILLN